MRSVILGGALAFILTIIGTPLAIKLMVRRNVGQEIREDGPSLHNVKQGTPTMGGIVFIAAIVIAYVSATIFAGFNDKTRGFTVTGLMLIGLLVGMGLIGFIDDFIKFRKKRSLGLDKKGKIIGQILVGVICAAVAVNFPNEQGVTPVSHAMSFTRDIPWLQLTKFGAIILFVIVVISTSNAVNLTDGLDGLATGASMFILIGFSLIGFWQWRHLKGSDLCTPGTYCYEVRDPIDVALIAAVAAGACFGFLWWNTWPAKIFMGDTGSLALGALIAGLAMVTHTTLLLIINGVLFVTITMSVIIQIFSFKVFKRRVFRMAPLQHHFELAGWSEVTIVVRFWIISCLGLALSLALFYADYVGKISPE